MAKTDNDNIWNHTGYRFIGYKEYLTSEATKEVAEERNIIISSPILEEPQKCEVVEVEEKEEVETRKERVNINNIAIIILGWAFIIWNHFGSLVSKTTRVPIVQIYGENTTFDLIMKLIQGGIEAGNTLDMVISIVAFISIISSFIVIIAAHIELYNGKNSLFFKIVSWVTLLTTLFVFICGSIVIKKVSFGVVITTVISLLIVILTMIKKEK
ncbi:MAG: hypothetical protein K5765_03165 [Clostridia bacterium]|nr:hypothetical protein [Clostridia bacterium]